MKLSNKPYWIEVATVYGITGFGAILSIFYKYNDTKLSMALITVLK